MSVSMRATTARRCIGRYSPSLVSRPLIHGVTTSTLPSSQAKRSFGSAPSPPLPLSRSLLGPAVKTVWPQPERVIALGDVHGDAQALEDLLAVSGLITKPGGEWAGGATVAVQIGDILDRGVGEVAITLRLHALASQAERAGGGLIRLLGNHEIMNYQADFRYVSGDWGDGYAPYEEALGATLDRDLGPGWRTGYPALAQQPAAARARAAAYDLRVPLLHPILAPFRSITQVAAVVGDSVFVHAGLVREHLKYLELHYQHQQQDGESNNRNNHDNNDGSSRNHTGGSSSGVDNDRSTASQLWKNAALEARESATAAGKTAASVESLTALVAMNHQAYDWITGVTPAHDEPLLLTHGQGPVWLRALSSPRGQPLPGAAPEVASEIGNESEIGAPATPAVLLRDLLRALECKRMVVGHTPQACVNAASVGGSQPVDTTNGEIDGISDNSNSSSPTSTAAGEQSYSDGGASAASAADKKSSAIHNAYSASSSPSSPVFTDAKSTAESWDGSGVIWRIDTGASSGIANGPREALEVLSSGEVNVLVRPLGPAAAKAAAARASRGLGDGLTRVPAGHRAAPVDLNTVDWLAEDEEI